jgi:hypothetical protein
VIRADAAGIADGKPVTMILHVGDFAYNMGDAGGRDQPRAVEPFERHPVYFRSDYLQKRCRVVHRWPDRPRPGTTVISSSTWSRASPPTSRTW